MGWRQKGAPPSTLLGTPNPKWIGKQAQGGALDGFVFIPVFAEAPQTCDGAAIPGNG